MGALLESCSLSVTCARTQDPGPSQERSAASTPENLHVSAQWSLVYLWLDTNAPSRMLRVARRIGAAWLKVAPTLGCSTSYLIHSEELQVCMAYHNMEHGYE